MPRQHLTTHQGQDYIVVHRQGQTTDDAIVMIRYPSSADITLAKQFAAAPDLVEALQNLLDQSKTNRAEYFDTEQMGRRWSNERVNMTSAAELMATKALAKAAGK